MTEEIGFSRLLGEQGTTVTTCAVTHYRNGEWSGENELIMTTSDGVTGYVINTGATSGGFHTIRNQTHLVEYLEANEGLSVCPSTFYPDGENDYTSYRVDASQTSQTSDESGIYEFLSLVIIAVGVVIICALIAKGALVGRKSVEAFTEETNSDENIEYYEGANGREYFRIKNKFRR